MAPVEGTGVRPSLNMLKEEHTTRFRICISILVTYRFNLVINQLSSGPSRRLSWLNPNSHPYISYAVFAIAVAGNQTMGHRRQLLLVRDSNRCPFRVCRKYGRPTIRMVMDVPGSFHGAAKISVDSVNP